MTAGDHDSHQATTFEHINGEMGELQLDGHSASSSVTQAMNPLGLHLISHPSRGNGVFTATAIPANTLIEESPVLVLSKEEWDRGDMNDTILGSYGFCWRNGGMALGLGLASLFNHSSRPNVNFIRSPSSNTIIFKTSRAVQPGEELCICYSADESKLWFTPAGAGSKAQGIEDAPELPSMEAWFQNLEGDEKVDERERREERARRRDEGKMTREKEKHLKYEKKQAALAQESIFQPRPMPFGTSSEASSSTTPCSTPPTYPTLPETTMAALPVPLHSGKGKSRHEHVGPVVLTAPLDWRAEDFAGNDVGGEDDWGEVMRIKGPAEEEEEKDFAGTMDIWVVEIPDTSLMRHLVGYAIPHASIAHQAETQTSFCKEFSGSDPRLRHLKRVARPQARREGDGEPCQIALCHADVPLSDLQAALVAYEPSLSVLEPFLFSVPATATRPTDGATLSWPIIFSPARPRPVDSRTWSMSRKAWVRAGIQRVLTSALTAKARNELPIAVYCCSAPESLWPTADNFIPPTPDLRASNHDTRISENHPLRHSTLNCIASIARLRTVPPFSEMVPTRNGADYLLTSMSLFITHEPCVMCCMALLHSRVREVFYIFPRKEGGFEANFGIHGHGGLNHRFEVWRWTGDVADDVREKLRVDDGITL